MKENMRAGTGILILLMFCGCASIPLVSGKELSEAKISLEQKERQIKELEAALAQRELKIQEKDIQLQEKDVQLQQLKEKLRGFGVF
ncbi:MAG: hypothetical protein ABIE81_04185 [Candidatus Omnitrophota bacterium]